MRRKTNQKTDQRYTALLLIPIILLSMSGFAYAQWNDIIVISSTMEFGHLTLRFVDPTTCSDNEATQNVGTCECQYADPDSGGYKTLVVTLGNAYPGYEGYCNFTLKNVGTLPEHVEGVTITPGTGLEVGANYIDINGNPTGWRLDDTVTHEPMLYIYVYKKDTDLSLVCNRVEPEDNLDGKITVQVTDGAKECQTYGFTVDIIYGQVT